MSREVQVSNGFSVPVSVRVENQLKGNIAAAAVKIAFLPQSVNPPADSDPAWRTPQSITPDPDDSSIMRVVGLVSSSSPGLGLFWPYVLISIGGAKVPVRGNELIELT